MATILLTMGLFFVFVTAMSIGLIVKGRILKGSCGGVQPLSDKLEGFECGLCVKKDNDVCPTDNPLVAVATIGNPNRTLRER